MADHMLDEPALQFRGWPDLVWVQDSDVKLIEVKTSDRLILNQVLVFPKIKDVLKIPVEVIKVVWTNALLVDDTGRNKGDASNYL